jgi:hypothetical protein
MKISTKKVAGLALFLLIGFKALGTDIYNTFTTYNGNAFTVTNNQQIGNEITLSSANVSLTGFSFEYYTPSALSGTVGVDLQFYYNNGASGSPGTEFYNSGSFSPLPTALSGTNVNYGLADFYPPLSSGFLLPTNFTFTLTFSGLASGDVLELLLGNPPSGQIGSTSTNYVYNTGSGFQTLAIPGVSGDLAVDINGNVKASDAPETAVLLGLSFVGMFVLRKKFTLNLNQGK